jgi:hypothetical protein
MANEERPTLMVDLSGPDGNAFIVITLARALLSGQPLTEFNRAIGQATLMLPGKQYEDILAIVNTYVRLTDASGLYAQYAWDEAAITAAVKHLNEQLSTLPDTVTCAIQEVYPEFDLPELSPVRYLALLEEELEQVSEQIAMSEEGQSTSLQQLKAMLQECISALHSAGV